MPVDLCLDLCIQQTNIAVATWASEREEDVLGRKAGVASIRGFGFMSTKLRQRVIWGLFGRVNISDSATEVDGRTQTFDRKSVIATTWPVATAISTNSAQIGS